LIWRNGYRKQLALCRKIRFDKSFDLAHSRLNALRAERQTIVRAMLQPDQFARPSREGERFMERYAPTAKDRLAHAREMRPTSS